MTIQAHRVGCVPRDLEPRVMLGPDLPQASCKGKGNLWDDHTDTPETPPDRAHRHTQALAICDTCPAKTACYTNRQTDPDLGPGIYGGHLFENTPTQRRRDRLARSAPQTCICKNCQQAFQAVTKRVYCDDTCYEQARAHLTAATAHTRRALPTLTHCQGCGKRLPPGRKRNCTDRCRKRGSEQRRHAARTREAA